MLKYLMHLDTIDVDELARGICSKNTLYKAKNGERMINGVQFYYMIRRLFLSQERFQIMIDGDENKYFIWLYESRKTIIEEKYEKLSEFVSPDTEKQFKAFQPMLGYEISFIRYIISMETGSSVEEAYQYIRNSVEYMISEDGRLRAGRYGTDELNRFMNYLEFVLITGKASEEKVREGFMQILEMTEMKTRDPWEEAKLYPRIVSYMLNSVGHIIPAEIWKTLLIRALECLKRTWRCYDLPEILRLLIKVDGQSDYAEKERYKKWYEAVCKAYDVAEYSPSFNRYDSHDTAAQLYLIHEYLKRNRDSVVKNGKTLSQQELSDGIMNLDNYSRVETGKHRPRKTHFEDLTRRLGVSPYFYQGEIVTENPKDFSLMSDIREAGNRGDKDRLRTTLKTLKEDLDLEYTVNRQFIDEHQLSLDIMDGIITREKSIPKLIEILSYTIPYRIDEKHVYTRLEGEILYRIVETKRSCGSLTDEDVEILRTYVKNVESAKQSTWDRKQLQKRLLAGILQTKGELKEAEKLARECVQEMVEAQEALVMPDCLDILAESIIIKDRDQAAELLKAAYWICDLREDILNKQGIEQFYQEMFQTSIN